MKRLLTALSLTALLALGAPGLAAAQTEPAETETQDDGLDDRWGLLGLLGLFGLFGYKHEKVPVTSSRGATASRDR